MLGPWTQEKVQNEAHLITYRSGTTLNDPMGKVMECGWASSMTRDYGDDLKHSIAQFLFRQGSSPKQYHRAHQKSLNDP